MTLLLASLAEGGGLQIASRSAAITLTVHVTEGQTEATIDHVRLELVISSGGFVQQAFSDSLGNAQFPAVTPMTYVLKASKPGYRDSEISFEIRPGDFSRTIEVQMQAAPGKGSTTVTGTVPARNLKIPGPARGELQKGAKLLKEGNDLEGSVQHIRKAIAIYPEYADAHFLLGQALLQSNSAAEAQSEFQKAIDLDPNFLAPYYSWSLLLFSQKRYAEEEQLLLRAAETDKQGWQWPFELARCYATTGRWDKALEYGKAALTKPQSPPKAHILLADIYSNTGNIPAAIEELEICLKLDPNSPYAQRARAALTELRAKKPE